MVKMLRSSLIKTGMPATSGKGRPQAALKHTTDSPHDFSRALQTGQARLSWIRPDISDSAIGLRRSAARVTKHGQRHPAAGVGYFSGAEAMAATCPAAGPAVRSEERRVGKGVR